MRVLKFTLIGLLAVGALLFGVYFIMDEEIPEGGDLPKAYELGNRMLHATGYQYWKDTRYVRWVFPGGHLYIWDIHNERVMVEWSGKRVLLNTAEITGIAWEDGNRLSGEQKENAIQDAWKLFCNDSFWLVAPYKIYSPDTEHSVVELPDGRQGLKVTYGSGGVTPGDTYVWLQNGKGLPTSVKMWVSVIPIGGIEFTWEEWKTLDSGAKIATLHSHPLIDLEIEGLMSGQTLEDVGAENGLFRALR